MVRARFQVTCPFRARRTRSSGRSLLAVATEIATKMATSRTVCHSHLRACLRSPTTTCSVSGPAKGQGVNSSRCATLTSSRRKGPSAFAQILEASRADFGSLSICGLRPASSCRSRRHLLTVRPSTSSRRPACRLSSGTQT